MIPKQFIKRAQEAATDISVPLQDVFLRPNPDGSVTGLYNGRFVFSYHPDRPSSFSYRLKGKRVEYYTRYPYAVYREAAANTRKMFWQYS